MRLLFWSERISDQPIGISAKIAIKVNAGMTNAHPARCSDHRIRLHRAGRSSLTAWLRSARAVIPASRGLARRGEDAVHLLGGGAECLLRLRLAEQHRLDHLSDHRGDLRIGGADWPRLGRVVEVL